MKRLMPTALAGAALAVVALTGAAATVRATPAYEPNLEIRYAYAGCHTWALNGVDGVMHVLRLQVGQSIRVVNHDVCMHTLVERDGATAQVVNLAAEPASRHVVVPSYPGDEPLTAQAPASTEPGAMLAFGEGVRVTFDRPGTYELGTVEEDSFFTKAWPTVGEDNELDLTVVVAPSHQLPIE
jgi:hypothetical protein